MADSLTMQINGDLETQLVLKALIVLMPQAAADVSNETMINVQTMAKEEAAVDTGRMRASIVFIPARPGPNMEVVVRVNAHYGIHVEFGTFRMKAQPFLGPAFAKERPKFLPRLKAEIIGIARKV